MGILLVYRLAIGPTQQRQVQVFNFTNISGMVTGKGGKAVAGTAFTLWSTGVPCGVRLQTAAGTKTWSAADFDFGTLPECANQIGWEVAKVLFGTKPLGHAGAVRAACSKPELDRLVEAVYLVCGLSPVADRR